MVQLPSAAVVVRVRRHLVADQPVGLHGGAGHRTGRAQHGAVERGPARADPERRRRRRRARHRRLGRPRTGWAEGSAPAVTGGAVTAGGVGEGQGLDPATGQRPGPARRRRRSRPASASRPLTRPAPAPPPRARPGRPAGSAGRRRRGGRSPAPPIPSRPEWATLVTVPALPPAPSSRVVPGSTGPGRHQAAEPAGHVAAPRVDAGDQLLAGVAPFGEADRLLDQAGFAGDGLVGQLGAHPRDAGHDADRLVLGRPA